MQLYCGQNRKLEILSYEFNTRADFEADSLSKTMTLTFVFDGVKHTVTESDKAGKSSIQIAESLAHKVLGKCDSDTSHQTTVKFGSRGYNTYYLLINNNEFGIDLKENHVRNNPIDPKLFVCLNAIAAYLRGEKSSKKQFRI